VITLAHRLHGTAGTYGFTAVSDAAGDVERAAREGGDVAAAVEALVRALPAE